jgi:TRAP-type C4-dicarboxylate transport system permease small subunit
MAVPLEDELLMAHDDGHPAMDGLPAVDEDRPPSETESLGGESNPELLPRREPWRTVVHAVGAVEQTIGALLLVVILVLVVALVAQRYLPGANFPWTGEVARLAMVWGTFVMAGYLAAHDRHIAIHVVDYVLGDRALAVVKLFVNVVVLVTCLGLVYATYQLIETDIGQVTPAAEIPLRLVYVIPLIGFALVVLRATLGIVLRDIPSVLARHERTA